MMGVIRRLRSAAVGWLASGCFALTHAATLQISPVTIELGPNAQGAAMTLVNPGDIPVHGQLRVFAWDQQNGDDVLSPSNNLVVSPPLMEIPPGEEQLVRIVRANSAGANKERSYRIFIDEIMDEQAMPRSGVVIRMRYSVPIFVDGGLTANDAPELEWTVDKDAASWRLRVDNQGEQRARISAVWVRDAHGRRHDVQAGLLGYALAGRYRVWDMELPSSIELGPSPEIHATVNAEAVVVTPVMGQGATRPGTGPRP